MSTNHDIEQEPYHRDSKMVRISEYSSFVIVDMKTGYRKQRRKELKVNVESLAVTVSKFQA